MELGKGVWHPDAFFHLLSLIDMGMYTDKFYKNMKLCLTFQG